MRNQLQKDRAYRVAENMADEGRIEAAVSHLIVAGGMEPRSADFLTYLGRLQWRSGNLSEAIAALESAVSADDGYSAARAYLLWIKVHACNWAALDEEISKLRQSIQQQGVEVPPLIAMSFLAEPRQLLQCARSWSRQLAATIPATFRHMRRRRRRRIRLGYLSGDFRNHPVGCLLPEIIEGHNRSAFEVIGYSYGPDDGSGTRRRLTKAFDRFVDVRRYEANEAAAAIYDDTLDILVDLSGYTPSGRPEIAAFRPAPIQVNFLGFPGTMGANHIDYIIADHFLIPEELKVCYSERIVYLPDCYQPRDTSTVDFSRKLERRECDLPPDAFVFCCLHTPHKITPNVLDDWARIVKAVPNSILWLFEANVLVATNLKREAATRGVEASRLVFSPPRPMVDYLQRLTLADLFLDTSPYSAGATASDALWMGLPILTCPGSAYVGRMSGALLSAAGLPELICSTRHKYVSEAIRLASDPQALGAIRSRLSVCRTSKLMFDMPRFVTNLERAYSAMGSYERTWMAGH
jgi:protein O-GlcNAc transferase